MQSFISSLLQRGGCSERQASEFERHLEDVRPAGVSTVVFCRVVRTMMLSELQSYMSHLAELDRENRQLRKELNDAAVQQQFDFRNH